MKKTIFLTSLGAMLTVGAFAEPPAPPAGEPNGGPGPALLQIRI